MTGEYGAKVRNHFIVVGYFDKWLVAINEKNDFFVKEESSHVYEIGTLCDEGMMLVPANFLPEDIYQSFCQEYMQ